MLPILFILLITTWVSLVSGINLALLLKVYKNDTSPSLYIFWGLIFLSIYLQMAYILFPINAFAWGGVILIQVFLCAKLNSLQRIVVHTKNIVISFKDKSIPAKLLLILILATCLLNIIVRPGGFDTGCYHLQAIKWVERYPVLPGLVNITCQFGFNSGWFLLNAFTGLGFIGLKSVYVMNCFILVLFISYLMRENSNSLLPEARFMRTFRIIYLVLCLPFVFFKYTGEVSPDFPVIIFTLWLFMLSVETAMSDDNNELCILLLFIAPIYLLTIKISSLPLCIFSLISLRDILRKHFKAAIILSLTIVIPWLYNNVIISGYLIFPVTFTNLDFDWSYPEEMAKVVNERIKGWARSPFVDSHVVSNMPFPKWVFIWYKGQKIYNLIILGLTVIGLSGVLLYRKKIAQKLPTIFNHTSKSVFVMVAGILFWFMNAPDFRFSYGYFFSLLTLLVVILLESSFTRINTLLVKNNKLNIAVITSVLFLSFTYFLQYNFHKMSLENIFVLNQYTINRPERISLSPDHNIFYSSVDEKCWDLYFPCTCELYDGIEMRGSDFTYGFRIKQTTADEHPPAVAE